MTDVYMLSIDSSSTSTGVTVWNNGKYHKCYLLNIDYWDKHFKDYPRLSNSEKMVVMLKSIIDEYKPLILIVEKPVVLRNPKTQSVLDRIVGFIQFYCMFNGTEFWEYRPTEWRHFVKGDKEKLPKKRADLKKWAVSKSPKRIAKYGDDVCESYLLGKAHLSRFK